MECKVNTIIKKITVGEDGFDMVLHLSHGQLNANELSRLAQAAGDKEESFSTTFKPTQEDLPGVK